MSPSSILDALSASHGISVRELRGHGRESRLRRLRQLAAYQMLEAGHSSREAGGAMGRSHATVLYLAGRWRTWAKEQPSAARRFKRGGA